MLWNYEPTGDWSADCATGRRLADELMREAPAPRLANLVDQMPRPLDAVCVGFLTTISERAM